MPKRAINIRNSVSKNANSKQRENSDKKSHKSTYSSREMRPGNYQCLQSPTTKEDVDIKLRDALSEGNNSYNHYLSVEDTEPSHTRLSNKVSPSRQ